MKDEGIISGNSLFSVSHPISNNYGEHQSLDCLTSLEPFNVSKNQLLILESIFRAGSSECRVCIHCNSNPENWNIVKFAFVKELILSYRNAESFC